VWFWLGFQTISRVIPGTGRAGAAFGAIPFLARGLCPAGLLGDELMEQLCGKAKTKA